MSGQHRATPELWAAAEKFGQNNMDMVNCILELRDRVEALEAAQRAHADVSRLSDAEQQCIMRITGFDYADARNPAMDELRAASAEARPGGLVERVAEGIAAADDEGLTNMSWNHQSRAAILAVAAWLRTGRLLHAAELLELEADRG